ncbi:N-acetyltransferase [Ornithinibacillus halotolerans]|uniref:N-acetyltransferase n=1 Tax=Ornithinibacillus halotolerans TaxID=1274357 RepID=A0A916S6H2_9BACI|nr:GNAT family N-acetyltransferase [Ornithinibacillus halotolerans]GGA86584.1 N-acetyltransferase [Ornithinibacillus halotolerans]
MHISQTKDAGLIAKLNKPVHDLHVELYPEFFKPYNFEEIKTFFQSMVEKENYIFLVLEDGDMPLGFAMIEIRNHPETMFKKAYSSLYVHQISVLNQKQKKGYGTRLMEAIEGHAKERGINRIELDYWSENEVASSLYEKNGYEISRLFVSKQL